MIIPGGLSSETSFGDEKFFVQTEFAQRPKPRVTTTISLNGAVVEKVENVWERLPQTEEDREEIEKFLKAQHQQVLQKIKNQKERLASFTPEKPEFGSWGEESIPGEDDNILKIREGLLKTEGVWGWVFVTNPRYPNLDDKQIMAHVISEPEDGEAENLALNVKAVSVFLPPVVKLGKFVGGILSLPGSLSIFVPLPRYFLAVKLDPKVDFSRLVRQIKSIT